MVRKTSERVATSQACLPLREMYAAAVAMKPRSWDQVEDGFLRAIEGFDANVAAGLADQGDQRNGKGDFFNDLLALLLENCAGISIHSRGDVPGFIFPKHMLDVTYPSTGPVVEFLLEAKAVGTPKHPGSPKQKNLLGRSGSADLPKRIKEAAFKTIDLKAEYGRLQTKMGQAPQAAPGGNLTTWARTVKPRSYLFVAARIIGKGDLDATIALAHSAAQIMDGVGIYCFTPSTPDDPASAYERLPVPRDVDLAAVLFRACQDLLGLAAEQDAVAAQAAKEGDMGPAKIAAEILDEAGIEGTEDEES